jgi:uncharacterized protein (DUF2342 family)
MSKLHKFTVNGDTYEIGLHDGLAEVAFEVNHYLQPFILRAQQSMSKMFSVDEIKQIRAAAEDHDGTPEGEEAAQKRSEEMSQEILMAKLSEREELEILISVLEGLPPKTMRSLMQNLITETLCKDGALSDEATANEHFRTRRANIYPLAAEIIRVNGFFAMDVSRLVAGSGD